MNKFKDIANKTSLVLLLVTIYVIYYWYKISQDTDDNLLDNLDIDGDGKISRSELKYYLNSIENRKKQRKIEINDLKKNITSGFIRGLLMGMILQDFEGGVVLGLILMVINPIVNTTEQLYY